MVRLISRLRVLRPTLPKKGALVCAHQAQGPSLRAGRPDWSFEWRNAKTGGVSTHRRHCVRSGLMKAALSATLKHAIKLNKLDEFYGVAGRLLQDESLTINNDHEAEVLIEKLFSRLHNNHMNIFYGKGSFNQMLGTLAHGLEKIQPSYFASLSEAKNLSQITTAVEAWMLDSIGYALCEYMGFSQKQEQRIHECLSNCLQPNFEFDAQAFLKALEDLKLFENRLSEGPMEIKVHQDRQKALIDVLEFMCERFKHLLTDHLRVEANIDETADLRENKAKALRQLKEQLKAFAGDILDSANLDLSQASDDQVRVLQNSVGIETTMALTELIEKPSLAGFEQAAQAFLNLETTGGQVLGLGTQYEAWFAKDQYREQFFAAVTAPVDQLVPTLESAKYSPRQWDANIRQAFKAPAEQQRLQIVPSTLIRQLGYAVSNFMVAKNELPELKAIYERLFGLDQGEIESIELLQQCHSKLLHTLHNNPTNLVLGSRAEQIARENMAFALETAAPFLAKQDVKGWFEHLCITALSGYISLIPSETHELASAINNALELENNQFSSVLTKATQGLELMQDSWIRSGVLARYDAQQLQSMRSKTLLLVKQLVDLHQQLCGVIQNVEKNKITNLNSYLTKLATQLQAQQFILPQCEAHPQIQAAQASLASFVPAITALRGVCLDSTETACSPQVVAVEYERILQGLLDSQDIAKEFGIRRWAEAVGAQ